ncbi:hypothetical protein D3C87_1377200 [compost metagenome]
MTRTRMAGRSRKWKSISYCKRAWPGRSPLRRRRHNHPRLNDFLRRLGGHCVAIGMVRVTRKPARNAHHRIRHAFNSSLPRGRGRRRALLRPARRTSPAGHRPCRPRRHGARPSTAGAAGRRPLRIRDGAAGSPGSGGPRGRLARRTEAARPVFLDPAGPALSQGGRCAADRQDLRSQRQPREDRVAEP